jgi:hypothetical protein
MSAIAKYQYLRCILVQPASPPRRGKQPRLSTIAAPEDLSTRVGRLRQGHVGGGESQPVARAVPRPGTRKNLADRRSVESQARVGDHPVRDAHIVISRIPLTVCRASRCRSGVRRLGHGSVLRLHLSGDRSGDRTYLLGDAPDKARELSCDRHADLVVLQASGRKQPVAVVEAQLCTPSDGAHGGGLLLLALLQWWAEARRETVIPRGLDQNATCMAIAGLGYQGARPLFSNFSSE